VDFGNRVIEKTIDLVHQEKYLLLQVNFFIHRQKVKEDPNGF